MAILSPSAQPLGLHESPNLFHQAGLPPFDEVVHLFVRHRLLPAFGQLEVTARNAQRTRLQAGHATLEPLNDHAALFGDSHYALAGLEMQVGRERLRERKAHTWTSSNCGPMSLLERRLDVRTERGLSYVRAQRNP